MTDAFVGTFAPTRQPAGETKMNLRYLLLLLIALYIVFDLFVPAMQNVFGYGIGTLLAIVIIWYVFFNGRGKTVL